MQFLKSLYQKKSRLAIVIILILIAGYFGYKKWFVPVPPTRYVTTQATKQTIVVSVTGTGQVSQDHTVNIEPQSSGQLTSIDVKQGQSVKAGQTIAVVDETNNTISLNQAKAGLASAQASYDQVMAGATSQSIQLAQLSVQSDQEAVQNASTSLATVIEQQKQDVANALTSLLNSGLQAIPSGSNSGNGSIAISGNYSDTQQGSYTVTVFNTGGGLQYVVSGLETSTGQVSKTAPVPIGTKGLYIQFAGTINNDDSWTIAIPNTLSSSYVSNQNAYQTAIINEASAISNAQNSLTSAENKLQQDQINLEVQQEPPTQQQVESAQASLTQAQASLQNAEISYNNNVLKAPFDGQVAQLNSQVGDQVGASTVVAVVTNSQSEAVIPLNEVDVASVKLGDKATMTFDAVNNLTITGTVVEIDNIGTVSQGVVNYNVKVAFDVEDPRVKPGMSVNVAVITDAEPDVLSVPSSAIKTLGSNSYVLTLDPTQTQTVPGQTGVTSKVAPKMVIVQTGVTDGTNTQITSGLNGGETVVTQTISSANTTAAVTTSGGGLGIPGLGGGGAATFRAAGGGGFGGGAGGAARGGG